MGLFTGNKQYSLYTRFTFIVVPLVLSAFVLLFWQFTTKNTEVVLFNSSKSLQRDAQSVLRTVQKEYENRSNDIFMLSHNPTIIESLASKNFDEVSDLFQQLKIVLRVYSAIELYNEHGHLIASSSRAMMADLKANFADDLSSSDWFQDAIMGNKNHTSLEYSDRFHSPVVTFYSPIMNPATKKTIGVIRTVYAWKHIFSIIEKYEERFSDTADKSRMFFLIEENSKKIVYHPDKTKILSEVTDPLMSIHIDTTDFGLFESFNYQNKDYIAAYSRDKKWRCIGAQSRLVSLAPIRQARTQMIIFTVALSILLLLIMLVSMQILNKKSYEMQKQILENSKLASIGELAAGVGHEINNPLAIAMGNIDRLKKNLDVPHDSDHLNRIEKIQTANMRIKNIVDGLRTYARADTDPFELISMGNAIEQTINLVAEMFENEGVIIKWISPEQDFAVRGSMGKLQQVIMNLISNAKDASKGQKNRTIDISLEKSSASSVVFTVSDNGCGISDKIIKKVFDPFFTTKLPGEGTGMGLGIVIKLVSEHGGDIKVKSEPGHTTFRVTLPLASVESARQHSLPSLSTSTPPSPKLSGLVLVVDDEEGIRNILRDHLEDLGLEVDEASDGQIALERVKSKQYNYIITDLKMPKMSGEKFIETANNIPNHTSRFYVITGGVTNNIFTDKQSILNNIVDGIITKPFTVDSIYEALRRPSNENKTPA